MIWVHVIHVYQMQFDVVLLFDMQHLDDLVFWAICYLCQFTSSSKSRNGICTLDRGRESKQ